MFNPKKQPIDNTHVIELEQADQVRNLLSEQTTNLVTPEVEEIVQHMAIAEIIN